jgi:hypothetical protein
MKWLPAWVIRDSISVILAAVSVTSRKLSCSSNESNMMHATSTVTEKLEMTSKPKVTKIKRGYDFIIWIVNYIWYTQKHQLLLVMTLKQ